MQPNPGRPVYDVNLQVIEFVRPNRLAKALEKARHNLAAEEESKRWHSIEEQLRRMGVESKREASTAKVTEPIKNIIDQTDAAIRMLDRNPEVAGARGMFTRGKEFVESTIDPTTPTPASEFQSQLLGIQSQWRKLPTVAANRFKADYNKIDDQIKGLGTFTSYAQARNNLVQFRDNLRRQMGESPETPTQPSGATGGWKVEKVSP